MKSAGYDKTARAGCGAIELPQFSAHMHPIEEAFG
jgi:hypothetical protein